MKLFQFFLGSIRILFKGGKAYYAWVALLILMVIWGMGGYVDQLKDGLGVTNMNDSVSWAFYIGNFICVIFSQT